MCFYDPLNFLSVCYTSLFTNDFVHLSPLTFSLLIWIWLCQSCLIKEPTPKFIESLYCCLFVCCILLTLTMILSFPFYYFVLWGCAGEVTQLLKARLTTKNIKWPAEIFTVLAPETL